MPVPRVRIAGRSYAPGADLESKPRVRVRDGQRLLVEIPATGAT